MSTPAEVEAEAVTEAQNDWKCRTAVLVATEMVAARKFLQVQ
jgi:hypothetical protein